MTGKPTIDHEEVIRLHREGLKPREIAEKLDVTRSSVYHILDNKVWKPESRKRLGNVVVTTVAPDLKERAERYCEKNEIKLADMVRVALREYLDNHQPKKRGERTWRE